MTTNWRQAHYLTLTEAADVMGVSRSQAYVLAHVGDLPTQPDAHGRRRVFPADLVTFLADHADDQPELFAPDDHQGLEERRTPAALPEPTEVSQESATRASEPTTATAAFRAARAALQARRRAAR